MCRVERYNLNFPDGHTEPREDIVICPRGTPNNPCHRREYVTLFNDRQATQEDIDAYARETAVIVQPGLYPPSTLEPTPKRKSSSSKKRETKVGGPGGLEIEFRFWNPFSSKRRRERKKREKMARRPTVRADPRITVVEAMPRAPSPPPAVRDPMLEPVILEATPRAEREEREERIDNSHRRRRRRKLHPVSIHQGALTDDASAGNKEDGSSSTPSPIRVHRPPRQSSPSPTPEEEAAAVKALRKQIERRERNERNDRNAEAERDARRRAEKQHEDEIRRERRRRSAQNSPQELERLSPRELAAQRQYEEDQAILRAERHQERHLNSPPASPSTRRTEIHHRQDDRDDLLSPLRGHRRTGSYEEAGADFIEEMVEDARRRRQSGSVSGEGSHHSWERGSHHSGGSGGGHNRRRDGGSR